MIFNLKKSFDNGKLIYEFISYLNKLNNLNVIKNQLSVLSKQNYLNNTQVDIVQWEKLNETDKNKYRIDETLINEKTKQDIDLQTKIINNKKPAHAQYDHQTNANWTVCVTPTANQSSPHI